MNKSEKTKNKYATALSWMYLSGLLVWLLIYLVSGDRWSYMGVINSMAVYLFLPLPVVAISTAVTRQKVMVGGTLFGLIVFLWFWGPLFTPRVDIPEGSNGHPPLTVMTYNVLGLHKFSDPIIAVIRTEGADVVCLQEVNDTLAEALQAELGEAYPYQILDPSDGLGTPGMGVISRYPIQLSGEPLAEKWIGVPQVVHLNYEGERVTLVNFHMVPYSIRSAEAYVFFQNQRMLEAHSLLDFVTQTTTPLIVAGDANDTFMNDTYRLLTQGDLQDAWWKAGFGLGHTFPGSSIPGSARLNIGDLYAPQWMTRIDYIFVSQEWGVLSARLAEFDGVSDHRGVVAELVLE